MWTWHNTHFELKDAQLELAILPLAATEPHGNHLPLGSDVLLMNAIAERVADRLPWRTYLLPTFPFGTSGIHRAREGQSSGAFSLTHETLTLVVRDLVESLLAQGVHRVAVLNNHGLATGNRTRPFGNYIVKAAVRQLNYDHPELDAVWVQPFVAAQPVLAEIFETVDDDVQAGEIETSLLMALAPELVRDPASDDAPDYPPTYTYFAAFRELAPAGVWGYPSRASAENGRRALEELVDGTAEYVESSLRELAELKR